jgi:hypothetical protein
MPNELAKEDFLKKTLPAALGSLLNSGNVDSLHETLQDPVLLDLGREGVKV